MSIQTATDPGALARRARPAAVLGLLLVISLVLSAPAFAGTSYEPAGSFGAPGAGPGQFHEPAGVAVNDSTGDVYVYDAGNRRVEWFSHDGSKLEGELNGSTSPTGAFTAPASISEHAAHGTLFNLAVDNAPLSPSAGDVYVVDPGSNVIDKFTASGAYVSQLTGFKLPVFGVAVDSTGDVWVAEEGSEAGGNHGPLQHFDDGETNVHLGEISPPKLRSPGLAVDSEQNLYLLSGEPNLAKYDTEGNLLVGQLSGCGCGTALGLDASTNDVFFDEGSAVSRYVPSAGEGEPPAETVGGLSASYGVAVNGATHALYATEREADAVAVFNAVSLPDLFTAGATEVTRTTATLGGFVNPGGEEVTTCEFAYGPTTSYGKTAPCNPAPGSGSAPVAVSAAVSGLAPATEYHFKLIAGNANGVNHKAADATFTTQVAVEGVQSEGASEVLGTTATLNGSLQPNGFDTHYFFEYGRCNDIFTCRTASYEASTPTEDAGSATETKAVSAAIAGLEPNEIYRFRVIAENTFGLTPGQEGLFLTHVVAPQVSGTPSASFITSSSAVLNATLDPEHTSTRYHFEYATCANLDGCPTLQTTPDQTSAQFAVIGATQEAIGLAPSTTYHYRLTASNETEPEPGTIVGGKANGSEGTFTTGAAGTVTASTGPATAIAATGATLTGTVDPDGQEAVYTFELGVYQGSETQYAVIGTGATGASSAPVAETLPVNGLQPGATYVYRIAIHGATSGATGGSSIFTTVGLPSALASPPALAQLPIPAIAFPTVQPSPPPAKVHLTRAQLLARALKACTKKPKSKRAVCKRAAEKKFGTVRHRKSHKKS